MLEIYENCYKQVARPWPRSSIHIWILIYLRSVVLIEGSAIAPAIYVFGDSLFDSGNNNFLLTLAKANFLPYGVNFVKGATGRFTNGKTLVDFIAEFLGLPFAPPYLSIRNSTILTGMNYASGSCGILPESGSRLGKCLNLKEQMDLFEKTVKLDLPGLINKPDDIAEYLSKSIILVSVGNNDFLNNYLQPKLYDSSKKYSPPQFVQLLMDNLSHHLERLYNLGARKIVMFEIGPLGCIPSIAKTQNHTGDCVEETNQLASIFNDRLRETLENLTFTLQGSLFVLGRANEIGYDAITSPLKYGLEDGSNPCCICLNNASSCIPLAKPCLQSNTHFFWDAFHLTESANSVIATGCFNGSTLCTPLNIMKLVQM
ncbi:GDSL esterase/lipase 7-like [Argentina anserina]|uniref:GDSL esterase/lipase 7-like n=1 Tax=Argentina anserina TaxID=57926 RepID=UPI002176458E|nr:GDSL esterase/lipase 7-like [Potentilla anserina]